MKNNLDKRNFTEGLQKRLWKCELLYRAEALPNGSKADWLAPYCESTKDIAEFLRGIGFQIANIVDSVGWDGDHKWVETKSGVIVYVNQNGVNGFVAGSKTRKRRKKCGF